MNKPLLLIFLSVCYNPAFAQAGGRQTGPPPIIRQDPIKQVHPPQHAQMDKSRSTSLKPDPFSNNRPLLLVDGVPIMSGDINAMVAYYRSFRDGSVDILLRDAVQALVPRSVMRAHFGRSLPAMEKRINAALKKVIGLEDWTPVVTEFSDDNEDDSPKDGAYVFGREVAVQPFDRFSHTLQEGAPSNPFLTVYGFHFLEVTQYEQKTDPKDNKTHVRHILVMFPELQEMGKAGKDIRTEIKRLVSECKIKLLEDGLHNILPPKLRGNIIKS